MNKPITREEQYYAKIAGDGDSVPVPITREEHFLAAIAGEDVTTPEPVTRKEMYLEQIKEQGGGGGDSPFELIYTTPTYILDEVHDIFTTEDYDALRLGVTNGYFGLCHFITADGTGVAPLEAVPATFGVKNEIDITFRHGNLISTTAQYIGGNITVYKNPATGEMFVVEMKASIKTTKKDVQSLYYEIYKIK